LIPFLIVFDDICAIKEDIINSGYMITFFSGADGHTYAVLTDSIITVENKLKLSWLFGDAEVSAADNISGMYIGPRASMITPWSTNAVEITQNMGISGIKRIELFVPEHPDHPFDPMLLQRFNGLHQEIFDLHIHPEPILEINDIEAYNQQEGLALSDEEVNYLNGLSERLGRKLTDSEVFGFSQVNSEHCRHKIFNGKYIIDGEEKSESLFAMIKKTSSSHPNDIVSAYKDNVAFIKGPEVVQFAPERGDIPSYYTRKPLNLSCH
jgi:phosphoribosylformylglycinamidine synthase